MARKLDNEFITDLLTGCLANLLNYVKQDNSLDLEIRDNYLNIYYLGGSILRVNKNDHSYSFVFDYNYHGQYQVRLSKIRDHYDLPAPFRAVKFSASH